MTRRKLAEHTISGTDQRLDFNVWDVVDPIAQRLRRSRSQTVQLLVRYAVADDNGDADAMAARLAQFDLRDTAAALAK